MKLTLKQLNTGFASLNKLAAADLPARHIKLAYKIKRVFTGAQKEFEQIREHLTKLVKEYGTELLDEDKKPTGTWEVTPENREKFNEIAEEFLAAEIELWGDPIKLEELEAAGDHLSLSAADLFTLDWLITDGTPAASAPAEIAAAAAAGVA